MLGWVFSRFLLSLRFRAKPSLPKHSLRSTSLSLRAASLFLLWLRMKRGIQAITLSLMRPRILPPRPHQILKTATAPLMTVLLIRFSRSLKIRFLQTIRKKAIIPPVKTRDLIVIGSNPMPMLICRPLLPTRTWRRFRRPTAGARLIAEHFITVTAPCSTGSRGSRAAGTTSTAPPAPCRPA